MTGAAKNAGGSCAVQRRKQCARGGGKECARETEGRRHAERESAIERLGSDLVGADAVHISSFADACKSC